MTTPNYGTLSLSELIVYNNNNTTTQGTILYDNVNENIIMNKGLDLVGDLKIITIGKGIRFGDNTIQITATDVTKIGDNTFTGGNTFDINKVTCNAGLKVSENVDISGNIDLSGNLIMNVLGTYIQFPDGSQQTSAASGGDVTTDGDNTFTGENTFDINTLTCNAGLKVSGNISILNGVISRNISVDGDNNFVMDTGLVVDGNININSNNNTGTISYFNDGGTSLKNFVFNLPTTTPNLSSEGGLLVNNYFTGSINFTDFNLSSISWKLKINTSGLINIVIKNKTSKISYSAFYNMFYIEISETEISTILSNISNSGNTIDDCDCSFDVSNTNGEFTLQNTLPTSTYDIQLYFTGVYFEVEPNW
jgi:hypothetical protein